MSDGDDPSKGPELLLGPDPSVLGKALPLPANPKGSRYMPPPPDLPEARVVARTRRLRVSVGVLVFVAILAVIYFAALR